MKDLGTIEVLQLVQEWCSSFMGAVTILALLAIVGTVIIMAAKESYGKGSFGHRVIRFVVIAIYIILAFNLTGAFIMSACSAIGSFFAGVGNAIGAFFMLCVNAKWPLVTLLAIIYILAIFATYDMEEYFPLLCIITLIVIGSTFGIFQSIIVTIIVGGVTAVIDLVTWRLTT